jgi:hypothetical protein
MINSVLQSLFPAVVSLFLLATPAAATNETVVSQTTTCITTQDEFYASAKNYNPTIYVASPEALATILGKINEARAAAGVWLFEADKLAVGIFTHEGKTYAGIVMFKDHCVVPGTVKVFYLEEWAQFTASLGISIENFTKEAGV